MPTTAIIVPARLGATRFPRKLLHQIRGRPIILWVADRISRQMPGVPLYFAVDDDELLWALTAEGHRAILTDVGHPTGTDRIAEANARICADIVVNVQADEPLVTAAQIELLAALVARGAPMATLATPFERVEDFRNPNQVKVVTSHSGDALYFSRAAIPFSRDTKGEVDERWLTSGFVHRHLGLYGYQAGFLASYSSMPAGRLEQIEKLEQLRALENGHRIAVGITDQPTIGIDTIEDAIRFERHLEEHGID